MDKNFYLSHLDQLTDRERSIFLYRIILKISSEETAKRLNLPEREIRVVTVMLREQSELLLIKGELIESFNCI